MKNIFLIVILFFLTSCTRLEIDSLYVFFISDGQIYSLKENDGTIKRLTNDTNNYESLSSSLDGEHLLLSDSAGKIYLLHYEGGIAKFFLNGKYATYGPSGKIYFAVKSGTFYDTIARCSETGDNIVQLKTIAVDADIYSIS